MFGKGFEKSEGKVFFHKGHKFATDALCRGLFVYDYLDQAYQLVDQQVNYKLASIEYMRCVADKLMKEHPYFNN